LLPDLELADHLPVVESLGLAHQLLSFFSSQVQLEPTDQVLNGIEQAVIIHLPRKHQVLQDVFDYLAVLYGIYQLLHFFALH
jgi:hypothetical protein